MGLITNQGKLLTIFNPRYVSVFRSLSAKISYVCKTYKGDDYFLVDFDHFKSLVEAQTAVIIGLSQKSNHHKQI